MEKDLLNKLKPLFVYTKNIGECIITAEMELRNVSSIYKYISKTNDEGNNLPVMPMIAMFKNTVEEVLESYGDEMIRHLDSESDEEFHSPTITIYPDEKKINIRDYANFIVEEETVKVFKNSERLMEDMIEDKVKYFEFDFWGSWGDSEFDISYVRGDKNVVPGLVNPYYRFFKDLLDINFYSWDSDEGSYGTIYVRDDKIKIICNFRNKEWGWTGFEKTLKVNS
jgi:hypothetical protein